MNIAAQPRRLRWSQVAAFRLARHHLVDRSAADLVGICRDVCGIQAQVMSSAAMACWARMIGITADAIHSALWKRRTLVKTSCMRQTLHLLPSADFPIYITALKRSRRAALLRGMARFGMTATDLNGLNALVMESLQPGPMSQRDLTEAVKPRLNKRIRAWMERFWSILRPAVVEGLICYGPEQRDGKGRRNDAVFVRVDQWLPRQKGLDEMKDELTSQHILLRRYLQAYGPATLRDFSFWSGISMKESREIWNSLSQELAEVSIEGQKRSILGRDLDVLAKSVLDDEVVRLLPGFDPYLLAHAEKDHIVSSQHYKRIYRNQGWISPVILINGRVVGIWSCTRKGKALSCKVELFEKVSKLHRTKIQDEAESLGRFLGGAISISLTA
jgi:uncharacterized protein YcaQ